MGDSPKDRWDKADVFAKALLPIAVALVGIYGSRTLNQTQMRDSDSRLYTELMTKREEADTALRQGMFESVLKRFLDSAPGRPDRYVLNLELLADNFHESMDVKPLFKDVERQILKESAADRQALRDRLDALAKQVSSSEIAVLSESGATSSWPIDVETFDPANPPICVTDSTMGKPADSGGAKRIVMEPQALSTELHRQLRGDEMARLEQGLPMTVRYFCIEPLDFDPNKREFRIRLLVSKPGSRLTPDPEVDELVTLSLFDFPMIHNIRLSHGERCALVISNLSEVSATISTVLFPGSRASLKEKPYYDEMMDELLHTQKKLILQRH